MANKPIIVVPSTSGLITSAASATLYVPYSGAISNVDLGARSLSATNITVNGNTTLGDSVSDTVTISGPITTTGAVLRGNALVIGANTDSVTDDSYVALAGGKTPSTGDGAYFVIYGNEFATSARAGGARLAIGSSKYLNIENGRLAVGYNAGSEPTTDKLQVNGAGYFATDLTVNGNTTLAATSATGLTIVNGSIHIDDTATPGTLGVFYDKNGIAQWQIGNSNISTLGIYRYDSETGTYLDKPLSLSSATGDITAIKNVIVSSSGDAGIQITNSLNISDWSTQPYTFNGITWNTSDVSAPGITGVDGPKFASIIVNNTSGSSTIPIPQMDFKLRTPNTGGFMKDAMQLKIVGTTSAATVAANIYGSLGVTGAISCDSVLNLSSVQPYIKLDDNLDGVAAYLVNNTSAFYINFGTPSVTNNHFNIDSSTNTTTVGYDLVVNGNTTINATSATSIVASTLIKSPFYQVANFRSSYRSNNSQPEIYSSSGVGSAPFNVDGNLFIQPATSAVRAIYFNTTTTANTTATTNRVIIDSTGLTVNESLSVNGNTTLGDAASDTLTVNSSANFNSNVNINGTSLRVGPTSGSYATYSSTSLAYFTAASGALALVPNPTEPTSLGLWVSPTSTSAYTKLSYGLVIDSASSHSSYSGAAISIPADSWIRPNTTNGNIYLINGANPSTGSSVALTSSYARIASNYGGTSNTSNYMLLDSSGIRLYPQALASANAVFSSASITFNSPTINIGGNTDATVLGSSSIQASSIPTGAVTSAGYLGITSAGNIVKSGIKQNKSLTLDTPTATEKLPLWYTSKNITINNVYSMVTSASGSPSVAWQLKYSSDFSATGTQVMAVTTTTQTTATNTTSTTTIPVNNFLFLTTSAAANTKYLNLTINYTENS